MNTTKDRKHSEISPSKLKNLEICPGWAQDKTQEEHVITARGTACHLALETGDGSKLTEPEDLEAVEKCKAWETANLAGQETLKEVKLDVYRGIWGFADRVTFDGPTATLVDYKFGFNRQEDAETNPAAQAYAWGIFQQWLQVDTVEVYYLYPRLDEISHAVFTRKNIPIIELRIATIVARAKGRKKQLNPAVDNCLYCGNKAVCPALHALALPIATRYAQKKEMALPAEYDPAAITDPVAMSKAKAMAYVLGKWCESVDFHALKLREESGVEIPGYEYRTRTGRKKITNSLEAWKIAENYVSQDQFLAACDVSVKQLGEAAAEHAPKGDKKKVAGEMEDKLRDAGVMEIGADVHFLQRAKL